MKFRDIQQKYGSERFGWLDRRARTRPNGVLQRRGHEGSMGRSDGDGSRAGELLALVRERGSLYDCDELDVIDDFSATRPNQLSKSEGKAPADKWSTP